MEKENSAMEIMKDLLWMKWYWGRFSLSTSVLPSNFYSSNCSTLINYPTIDSV
jgi:hypothetical protein